MHDHSSTTAGTPVDLRNLPVFTPDPALWARVVSAQGAQRHARNRRRFVLGVCGAAAAAVCAAVLLVAPSPLSTLEQEIVAGQRESQALEGEWLRAASSTRAAGAVTRLRAIDETLQAAYDRGARTEEVARLWQQRNRALRELIAGVHDTVGRDIAARITRI